MGEAAAHCRAVLQGAPDNLPALQMLRAIAMTAGRMDEALALARRAVAAAPQDAGSQGALGALLLQQGRAAEALAPLDAALKKQPRNAGLLNSKASALQALGRTVQALAAYDRALAAGPPHPEALYQRGELLLALRRPDEALRSYDKALALKLDPPRGQSARGRALLSLGRWADAAASFEAVLIARPDDAPALNNLAVVLRHQGRDDEALRLYETLLARDAANRPARFGRAQLHLAHGRFAAGWDDYRARQSVDEHLGAICQDGLAADLTGRTIWLRKDQGLGDELFFLRFAPALKRRGARIVYQAGAKLAPLLRRAAALDEVIGEDDLIPEEATVVSVGDLPHLLGHASAAEVPLPLPLAADPARVGDIAARLAACGPAPYVGVTWRAGTLEQAALHKEIALPALARALAALPGTLISAQRLPGAGETAALAKAAGRKVHDFSALNDDLEAMLALMSALDAYVGVSNTNVHLRASAGRPSHVLVPMPGEWRWMATGDESPWFPASRVYRQAADGGWERALRRLAGDLEAVFSDGAP